MDERCEGYLTNMSRGALVGRGATYMFFSSISATAIGLVYFLVIARTLTTEELGVYALLTITLTLIQTLGLFGLPSASIRYIAQYMAEGNRDKAESVVARVFQLSLATSTVALFLVFISAEWLSALISGTIGNALLFRLFALISFFAILNAQITPFLMGLQKMGAVALIYVGYTTLQSVVGIYLVLSGLGLLGIVLSWLIGTTSAFAATMILTLKYLGVSEKRHSIRQLLNFSYPLYIAGIIGFFASYVDSILLVSYISAVHSQLEAQQLLGIYYVAVRASNVPAMLSTSIVTALFPQLSELYVQQGMRGLKDGFNAATRYSVLTSFPLIIGLAILASPIVILFGGWEYRYAGLPLTVLCLAAIPVALTVAIPSTLMTLERTKTVSLITIISILSTLAVAYVSLAYFYPNLGLTGPAWARTISSIAGLGLGVYVLKRIFSFSFDKEAIWKTLAASLLMTVAILLFDVARQVLTPPPPEFLLPPLHLLPLYVVVGAVTYFFSLVALKAIKKRDVELFQEYLPKGFRWMAALLKRLAQVD